MNLQTSQNISNIYSNPLGIDGLYGTISLKSLNRSLNGLSFTFGLLNNGFEYDINFLAIYVQHVFSILSDSVLSLISVCLSGQSVKPDASAAPAFSADQSTSKGFSFASG